MEQFIRFETLHHPEGESQTIYVNPKHISDIEIRENGDTTFTMVHGLRYTISASAARSIIDNSDIFVAK